MIDLSAVTDIISTYEKHGWKLRRVLLSAKLASIANRSDLFGRAEIRDSLIDGLWFSRRSRRGTEAWELRAISLSPFALLENIPDELSAEDAEDILHETEHRLAETVIRPSAN